MAYIGAQPNKTLTKTTSQSFNGTGSATVFTLNRAVNTEEELEVFVENVQQEPGSGKSYTASGTTLTFDAAPPSGTGNIYVIYRGQAEVTTRLEHDANQALAATTGTFSGAVTVTSGEIKATSGAVVQESNNIRSVMGNDGGSGVLGTSTNHPVKMFANNVNTATLLTGGGLSLTSGNLVLTSGYGIDFSATANSSGTVTHEILDDYEIGSFTPTYGGFTTSSVSANTGRYTKIGNQVMVQVDLQNVAWTSGGGQLSITNLPFAAGAQRTFTGTFAWYYLVSNLGTADALAGYIAGGTSTLLMFASQNNHIWHTIATPSSGSNGYFSGTFVYRT